ncbi:MAG: M28 family peptidase, partial [Candidatus Methanoperedens sp.]|nr:M28 family peptidase [Candidatus Methanoperedens sp.]
MIKEGESPGEVMVVGAHHDTVRDTTGADDNAASIAVLLELARVLEPYHFKKSIIFAALDMEELNLFGLRALVSELSRERRITGGIIYETMGFTVSEPYTQSLPPGMELL